MKRLWLLAMLALATRLQVHAADVGKLLFRLTADESLQASVAAGKPEPIEQKAAVLVDGKFGKAVRIGKRGVLRFDAKGNMSRARGTVCMWVRPNWDAEEKTSHALFCDDIGFAMGSNSLKLWEWYTGMLRFDVRDKAGHYMVHHVAGWRKGEWRHVAAAWDCEVGAWLFYDGDMVISKKFTWEPKPCQRFALGAEKGPGGPPDADLDDVRIYDCALTPGQVRRVMAGQKLQRVRYVGLSLPSQVTAGQPFEAKLIFSAPEPLGDGYSAELLLDNLQVGSMALTKGNVVKQGDAFAVSMKAVVPRYLYPAPGKRQVTMRIAGTFQLDGDKARAETTLALPAAKPSMYEGRPDWAAKLPAGVGLLVDCEFFTGEQARRKAAELANKGGIVDALPCRLVDRVDCAKTDHGYWENSPASVEELVPGVKFRCVGPQKSVTQIRKRHNREMKALAAFGYRLKVAPRPTPQLVVVESVNDAERYLEVAIDHPRDSKPAAHLLASGCGARVAIHLSTTYTGREYQIDGKPFRQAFMIFPKTDAVNVLISGTARRRWKDAKPAAVSRISVYEVAEPLGDLGDPLMLPAGQPQRSTSIFFPAIKLPFEKYGFTDSGRDMRASTLRLFVDYMRFMGLNRFELRPFWLSEKTCFKTKRFEQDGDLDFFAEALPIFQQAGIDVVPRVMYLHCYHKLLDGDAENFQIGADGATQKFGREGPIPDPLRPPVQKVVMESLKAMLEACEGYSNVPEIGFDTSIGGLYGNRSAPTSHTGYSKWDIETFAKDTGVKVPAGLDAAGKRFDWLKANAWDKWIDWRCRRWHAFVVRMRDLAKSHGKRLELSVRIMPREEFWKEGVPIKDIYRYTGFDPDLFRNESGIIMDYFIRINADRYFGRWWWKPWFYDPSQPELFESKEPRHVELYFNYWELPSHPWGFRVGPGSPVGRNFFEPLTYAMRTINPRDVTLFNWFRATIGRELEVREFCRAFRALPAVEPRDFDGAIGAKPMDERLWVKWFGDRLAVVNDAGWPREVTLNIPTAKPVQVIDAALCRPVEAVAEKGAVTLRLALRPFDMRTLVFKKGGAK